MTDQFSKAEWHELETRIERLTPVERLALYDAWASRMDTPDGQSSWRWMLNTLREQYERGDA